MRTPKSLAAVAMFAVSPGCASHPAGATPPHGHHGHGFHHGFKDAAAWSNVFDAKDRDAWQRPDEVVSAMAISPGMTVADLGAGTGYFLPYLSRAVGAPEGRGRVLALDIEPDMVAFMTARIEKEKLANASAREVKPDDPGLSPASVDRILVVDTWHHLDARGAYAAKLAAALKPGGAVLVVDFTLDAKQGPPPELRLAPEAVVADLVEGGLVAETIPESLPDQYIVRGVRKTAHASR